MAVVRYVALIALVVWLGAVLSALAGDLLPDVLRQLHLVAYACGAVVLIGLMVMKFVGPPPRAFVVRIAIVALMLAVTAAANRRGRSSTLVAANLVLGLIALTWYARE